MKNFILSILTIVLFSSCQSIKFDRYPGEAKSEFPENIRGKYTKIIKNGNSADTVSVYIAKDSYTIYNSKETAIDFLDSEHVFSTYNDYSFLFLKEDNFWQGYSVEKTANGISVLHISVPNKGDYLKNIKYVSKFFDDVKCIKTSNVVDIIECTAKMDEKKLLKYIKKNKRNKINLIQD